MLRIYQIDSNAISYSGGVAQVTFTKKATRRSAIIAVTPKGVQLHAHQNLLTSFKVDGREHVAGSSFPLALISNSGMPQDDETAGTAAAKISALTYSDETTGTAADVINDAMALDDFKASVLSIFDDVQNQIATLAACGCTQHAPQYFAGSVVQLPNGQRVGGIPLEERQTVTMALSDLTTSLAPLTGVTLTLVDFPTKCRSSRTIEAMWDSLKRGVGVVNFHGVTESAYSAAGSKSLEYKPLTHGAKAARQLEIRGSLTNDSDHKLKESEFANIKAEISTATESTPTNATVNARTLIGTGANPVMGAALVDLEPDESAKIGVTLPAPSSGNRTLRLCVITEGRDVVAEKIKLAAAPN
ncbi:hypothetical protein OAU50_02190 [Planctomycetota bacterium]|nr:hypothetical protein [Planctomycetota bacterium]